MKRFPIQFIAGVVVGATLFAGVAYTADPKLDLAYDNTQKALALFEATDVPDTKGQRCQKHVDKGIKFLLKVQERIVEAKACADQV